MRTSRWQFSPSLKLIRPSVASLQRYCCWYVTWPCDLNIWPFDFGQWSYMACHVINPTTEFEDHMAIRSWVMSSDISHRIPLTGEGRSLGGKISGGRGRPPANILIPLERQMIALQLSAESSYIMKIFSRRFVIYCRNCPKYDKFRYFIPILRKLRAA